MDRRVLLRLKAIDALQSKESAQALYTYIESLPQNPVPISMKRMWDRLNLTSNIYTQNHTVRKAMTQLKDIGRLYRIQTGALHILQCALPKFKTYQQYGESPASS